MEHSYSHNLLHDMNMDCQVQFEEKTSDELLIDAVRGYPHLYDASLKEYKDTKMKENSWHEISSVMNMSVDICQTRWLRLRERFTKEQRLQEIESRSGSKASHRSVFSLYQNMIFLKNHIKRRKSYTNVAKKKATDMSNVCVNTTSHYLNTLADSNSTLPSSNSNIVRKEIIPKTIFPQHSQETNLQTVKNVVHNLCISQNNNMIEIDDDESSPPLQNELNNFCKMKMSAMSNSTSPLLKFQTANAASVSNSSTLQCPIVNAASISNSISSTSTVQAANEASISNSTPSLTLSSALKTNTILQKDTALISNSISSSPILQTPNVSSNSPSSSPILPKNIRNSGKMKNKNITHLESSLASLSNVLQNRFANSSHSTENKENAWDLNHLTPEKSFGLLIAVELERIPEPEKTKRKQAILEILWRPYIH
ncbi:uncharacterized protein LOC112465863 [Temnothorax curvispinosus]|uniref:Uncharacterized protein LOC112465863 n=1 Tax=Temnothorax curvispinosus TaxID=300111 RepID=A0A6J1R313_9HYME|nr:uncharacterized protein LOC112465863 [Temnothorax curvispinosus]